MVVEAVISRNVQHQVNGEKKKEEKVDEIPSMENKRMVHRGQEASGWFEHARS